MGVLETTVQAQEAQLRLNANQPAAAPVPEPVVVPEAVSAEEFWANPSESVRAIVEDTVKGHLDKVIKPFQEDSAAAKEAQAWNNVTGRNPDLPQYKNIMNTLLQRQGNSSPTEEEIETVYFAAVGMANRSEQVRAAVDGQPNPNPVPARNAPPQHQPSSHPTLQPPPETEPIVLTENEARLARENGQTPEEYARWRDMPEDEVLIPDPVAEPANG